MRRQIEDVILRRSEEQKKVKRNDPKRCITFPDDTLISNDSEDRKKPKRSVKFMNEVAASKQDNKKRTSRKSPVPNPVLSNTLSVTT